MTPRSAFRRWGIAASVVVSAGCADSEAAPKPGADNAGEGAAPETSEDRQAAPPAEGSAPDGASIQGEPAPLPFEFCERAGSPPFDQLMVMLGIATRYDARRRDDCRTEGLAPLLAPDREERWYAYLVNFSMAMSGCPLIRGPAPGGIFVFGPANTRAIGLDRPLLGRDDVALLLEQYLDEFAGALSLSTSERSAVETHLWSAAEDDIDSNASAVLSRCPDAGN